MLTKLFATLKAAHLAADDSGLHSVACDDEASEKFEIVLHPVAESFWKLRIYLSGYVQGLCAYFKRSAC